jgi:hypothetical protein
MDQLGQAPSPIADGSGARTRSNVGWWVVATAVGAVLLLAMWLAGDTSEIDPNDPGWGDIAFAKRAPMSPAVKRPWTVGAIKDGCR